MSVILGAWKRLKKTRLTQFATIAVLHKVEELLLKSKP